MITRDFHGWTIQGAVEEVHRIIGAARMMETTVQVEFITGHGIIQEAIMDEMEYQGLSPSIQLGNSGVVTVIIE